MDTTKRVSSLSMEILVKERNQLKKDIEDFGKLTREWEKAPIGSRKRMNEWEKLVIKINDSRQLNWLLGKDLTYQEISQILDMIRQMWEYMIITALLSKAS